MADKLTAKTKQQTIMTNYAYKYYDITFTKSESLLQGYILFYTAFTTWLELVFGKEPVPTDHRFWFVDNKQILQERLYNALDGYSTKD